MSNNTNLNQFQQEVLKLLSLMEDKSHWLPKGIEKQAEVVSGHLRGKAEEGNENDNWN